LKKWDLPKGWEWKTLQDVVHINMGQSPPGESYNSCCEGMPFLQGNAEFGELHPTNIKWTTSPTKKVSPGTILISVRAPIGDINFANKDYCIGRGLAGLSAKKCDLKFLYYYLKKIRPSIEDLGTGSTFKAISKTTIEDIPVPVPPLETQQKIVAILDKVEEIKRLRAEANAQTQKLIQSVFLEMFGDPVKNTKEWTVKPLGKIANLVNGKAFKPRDWKSSGLPIIRIQNLNNLDSTYNYYDGLVEKRYLVRYGDLLFAWSGTPGTSFGAHIWVGGDAVLNQHIYNVIIDNKSLNKKYLEYAINGVIDSIIKQSHGSSGLAHITKKELEKVGIACPPIALQNEFESIFQKIMETIIDNSLINARESNSLNETVLKNAFTGELVA